MEVLLEEHAFVDAESPNKSTPLMMAAKYGSPEAVKLLLENGAIPTLRNELGLTAIDFAQQANRKDAAELIAAAVARAAPAKASGDKHLPVGLHVPAAYWGAQGLTIWTPADMTLLSVRQRSMFMYWPSTRTPGGL